MKLFYNLGISLYYLSILLASVINKKARLWLDGRKNLFRSIASEINPDEELIWFHCSSLGEFEQGRPVMEKLKERIPTQRILLTFYSPSGYEIRKDWPGADFICYLPLDTRRNAKRFLGLLNIKMAFFIKYEFWYHFLSVMNDRQIPVYLVSGIFRKNQVFFRWYGAWYRRLLTNFEHLFLQQEGSAALLRSAGITNYSVEGDTRFDRVHEIVSNIDPDERFLQFCGDKKVVVAGSTWPADEELILRFINETDSDRKWIIAPHEIHEGNIQGLVSKLDQESQRYTSLDDSKLESARILIIDTIGILSTLYQYADVTYIGGGFGKGIHNTLEAASFGKPVLFGPNFRKFQEAIDLVNHNAAYPVSNFLELKTILEKLLENEKMLKTSGESATNYVKSMLGASSRIVDFAMKRLD